MPDIPTPYRVPGVKGLPVLATPPLAPLDARTRLLVTGICRVLLAAVDMLQEVYELPRRAKGREREQDQEGV